MQVRDLMTTTPIRVAPETSVSDAWELMTKARIRHLLVTEDNLLVGIVTDRDIRLNLPSPATSLSAWELKYLLKQLTVGQAMRRPVFTIAPDRDVREAGRIMLDRRIGALPVTDGRCIVGIVTETDLLRAFVQSADPSEAMVGARR
jgi:acetoin utilization protein AcuB